LKRGVIFDIKEFAIFDGPGIRQTVFLKGCPLRCSWCHNPEGLSPKPQLMVSSSGCLHCGACEAVCRQEHCTACGSCIPACPLHLRQLAGTVMTSAELEAKLRENSGYYAAYGGGVTFSGGEPLAQADFLLEMLERIPDLHRAVETSGYADAAVFQAVAARLDYIIMDIKLADPVLHRRYVGVDNARILENAAFLCAGEKPFVIRIPLIPGVTDTEENYTQTARLLHGAKALQRVELLPYHKTAGAKYTMVGKTYAPDFDPERPVNIRCDLLEQFGIRSEVL